MLAVYVRRSMVRVPLFCMEVTAKSQARAVRAIYVSDGFTHEDEAMHAPSNKHVLYIGVPGCGR